MKPFLFLLLCLPCHGQVASFYAHAHHGKLMANGERFNMWAMTAASWDYPLGSKVRVTHGEKSVILEITDRGPARRYYRRGRKIDLSYGAFAKLASPRKGLIKVKIERVK